MDFLGIWLHAELELLPPAMRSGSPLTPPLEQHELGDIKIEYHPRSGRPPQVKPFEEFMRQNASASASAARHEPWAPGFRTRIEFEFADFVREALLDDGSVTTLLRIIGKIVADPSQFKLSSANDVKASWAAAAERYPSYTARELSIPYRNTARVYTFYGRPLWDWALTLVRDRILAPHFAWNAIRLFKWNGVCWVRFITEPYTANAWWRIEGLLPPNGVPLCFVLYSDKTHLSSFGSQKGYPIMARLANLPSAIRNSGGFGGGQVVGFLPVVEDENEEGKPSFTAHKRVVWHECFWIILEFLAKVGKLGELYKCGDDILRLLFPIILILAADYEEQVVMALIRGLQGVVPCPVCLVPAEEQSILGMEPLYPLRDVETSQRLVTETANTTNVAREAVLQPLGLRPIQNVFWKIPYCDVYSALSFDSLHAYHSGLFRHHLFDEFQKTVTDMGRATIVQVNKQFDLVPRWRNLDHFAEVAKVTFADGGKYEAISKVLVPATYNIMSQHPDTRGYRLLRCIRKYNILDIHAGLRVYTDERKESHCRALLEYSDVLPDYQEVHPEKNWNFPKAHTHQHVPTDIMEKGITANYNTKIFGKLHRPVKAAYQNRTNFKNIEKQLARIDHEALVADHIRAHIQFLDDKLKGDPEDEDEVPTYRFHHIYLGAHAKATFSAVEAAGTTFPAFRARLQEYLPYIVPIEAFPAGHRIIQLHPNDTITVCSYLKVDYESKDTWEIQTDRLRCNPRFFGAPRYDCVIFKVDEHDYRFAQLKLLFVFTWQGVRYPIAFVEPYEIIAGRRSEVDRDFGLCRVWSRLNAAGERETAFIPARSIVRGALILADHDIPHDFLVVDMIDTDMFLRLWEYVPVWNT
ncbi:hypothetical protein FKP32DRAFT_1615288 [Trametes sanguinea]|nr:hypothetical protein FKP32DRAFT_1615288 [Trametes sanguinea]